MATYVRGRRSFLRELTALGAAGLPVSAALWPRPVYSAQATARSGKKVAYDPAAKSEITVSEVEFRRNAAGRMLMARVYQPQGQGPFPTLLDLHGGAWNAKDRRAEEPMDRAIAGVKNNTTFFKPWDTIFEANPQQILERHEKVTLVPMLIMQGALDDNVLPSVQQKFAESYKAAGGEVDVRVFEGSVHEWVAEPGPQTDRAREMVKAFIARHVKG